MQKTEHIEMVSIIIPVYNAQSYIKETVDSVLKQTYFNFELVLVNDGSTDSTTEIIDEFAKRDKRIIVIHKKNSGVSSTRNEGISVAKGSTIFFLDADDIWNPNNVEHKVNYLNTKKTDAVFSACEMIDEKSVSFTTYLGGSENLTLKDMLSSKGNYTTAPSGIAIKKVVLDKIGGFDINLSNNADQDFFIRILAAGYKIGYIPDALWKYRIHSESMSKNVKLLERDILYVFNKANKNNLFHSFWFKQKCFSKIYLTLAGSWWKNGNNKIRALLFLIKAFMTYPPTLFGYILK